VEVARPSTTVATITQGLVKTGRDPHDKRDTLRRLIGSAAGFRNAIIFCNRKREVATLHRSLLRHRFSAAALHGDMDQTARMAALESFRRGEVSLLVASDVAARGLDIPDVSHIFNFDVPHHAEDYVHRIGRTGRAGKSGTAITIVAPSDHKAVAAIEKLIGQTIPWMPDPSKPAPAEKRPAETRPRENARHAARGPRRPQPERDGAPVTQLRAERDRRTARPEHSPPEAPAAAHLPAFLLRPVRVKA
jgi:superfamily II DNA/RNA helicase